jgi:PAS domain S-box-containing protein
MKDEKKTKAELIEELARLRRLEAELEAAEAERAPPVEALRRSEENCRTLQVNIPVGIFRSTAAADGRLLSVNVALAQMLGYDAPEDAADARAADFYFKAEDRRKLMEKITSAGTVSGYEVELRRADGTTFWGAVSARGVRGDDGEIAYFDGVVEDVTERKQAEAELAGYRQRLEELVDERTRELKEANEKLRREVVDRIRVEEEKRYFNEFTGNIIESTQVGIYALDKDGTVKIWNQGMERQFGVDSADIEGKNIFETFPILAEEPLGAAIKTALGEGEPFEGNGVRHQTLIRGERVLNTKINALTNPSGVIVGAVVITEDVTEAVKAAEALRESEERYRGLYHTTLALADEIELEAVLREIADQATLLLRGDDCIVYLLDRDGGILKPLYANTRKGAEAILSFDVRLGVGVTGRVAESGVGSFVNIGAEDDYRVHVPGTDATGDENESVIAVPMFDGSDVLGVITICKDGGVYDGGELEKLTVFARQAEVAIKRARSLEALRNSEDRYRSLVEAVHGGFAIVDGDENILFVNQAYCDMLGYAKEELTGMNVGELVTEEEFLKLKGATEKKVSEREPTKYETVMQRKDGSEGQFLVSSTPFLDERGDYKYTLGVALDITDQKRTEGELKLKTRQLEEAHRHADELLRNILPEQVIKELEEIETPLPRSISSVTIVFIDIAGFSDISTRVNHKALVTKLAAYFHAFDLIVKDYGLEKLKTVGDGYMYAGGLFAEDNQLESCAKAALDILKVVGKRDWQVRIGIHIGPCIAGLVKGWRMVYDVWGDTVNVASRLQEASEPGHVNVSEAVYEELADRFEFGYRGELPLYTLGPTPMYYLKGIKGS